MNTRFSLALKQKNDKVKNLEEKNNLFNEQILDSILDDNEEQFFQLLSQLNNEGSNVNRKFTMTNYKFPFILSRNPSYAALCALFGAEKCFSSLLMFFNNGINSDQLKEKDSFGRTLVHYACFGGNLNILRELDQANFDLNSIDFRCLTPSHYASISGKIDALKYMILKGIDIISPNQFMSTTTLHEACLYGNLDIVQFIIEKVPFETKLFQSNSQKTLLHLACEGGHSDIVEYLLTKTNFAKKQIRSLDNLSRTPVTCAIQNGNFGCVKALVNFGGKKLDCGKEHFAIIDAAADGHADIVWFLIRSGFDVNVVNSKKLTALQVSINNQELIVIKILIENGAIENFDRSKSNELFVEALKTGNIQIIEYLEKKLKIKYDSNEFIDLAMNLENEDLVNYLLDKNCSFDGVHSCEKFIYKWTPFMNFLKAKNFKFSELKSKEGIPLIVQSIQIGNLPHIKRLLIEGITLNKEIISKYDCIQSALKTENLDLVHFLLGYEPQINDADSCFELLLNICKTKSKRAIIKDCLELAKTFLNKYNANPNNESIIRNAASNCLLDILNLLAEHSADFNKIKFDYSKMITSNHLKVFKFLELNGYHFNYIEYHGKSESPLKVNFRGSKNKNYDINTFLFLINYSDGKDMLNMKFGKGNIIDFLLSFKCYQGILQVYKKINQIFYPIKLSRDKFLTSVTKSGNENLELIDMINNASNLLS